MQSTRPGGSLDLMILQISCRGADLQLEYHFAGHSPSWTTYIIEQTTRPRDLGVRFTVTHSLRAIDYVLLLVVPAAAHHLLSSSCFVFNDKNALLTYNPFLKRWDGFALSESCIKSIQTSSANHIAWIWNIHNLLDSNWHRALKWYRVENLSSTF